MLRADVLMIQPLRFFCTVSQDALTFVTQRQIYRRRYLLADGGVAFDLLANRFYGCVRP